MFILVTSGYTSRSLKQNLHQYDQLKLSRVNLEIFSNAMKTTLTLSYDILLVLFLEIRLHCFYHLSLLFRNASHYAYSIDTDPDESIMSLNRDLTRLQETLHSSLNEKKIDSLQRESDEKTNKHKQILEEQRIESQKKIK